MFRSGRRQIFIFPTLAFILCILLCAQPGFAKTSPSSTGAANYYEMQPSPAYVSLGVKGYQQTTDYTCGPAAVMSLLRWYGKLASTDMNAATEMRIAAEMGTRPLDSPRPGTDQHEIVNWLNTNGFRAYAAENGSLEIIRGYLNKGVPVLVEWIDWGGHWVVATGYHAGTDTIFFADPGAHWSSKSNPDGITSFNAWRFRDMWFDVQYLSPGQIVKGVFVVAIPN